MQEAEFRLLLQLQPDKKITITGHGEVLSNRALFSKVSITGALPMIPGAVIQTDTGRIQTIPIVRREAQAMMVVEPARQRQQAQAQMEDRGVGIN